MNKTFKVARSLTRGTVVTSEKASSYQGKAVKTVIAAAVASLVTGAAMAANVYVADGAALTFGSDGAESPKATVTLDSGKVYSDEKLTTEIKASALATKDTIYLVGGTANVNAASGVAQNVTAAGLTKGTLVISAFDSATASSQKNATVEYSGTDPVGNVTVEFAANTGKGENKGVSSLKSTDTSVDFTLGIAADDNGRGAKVTTLKTASSAAGTVEAATDKDLILANVAFDNQGELTLTGKNVVFQSAYADQAGKLNVVGAGTISNTFSSTNVVIGAEDDIKDVTASFNDNVTVSGKGTFAAEQLTVNSSKKLALDSGTSAEITTADLTSGTVELTATQDKKTTAAIKTLNLKGTGALTTSADATVTGDVINATGTSNTITNVGTLTYTAVNATAGDAATDLSITNTGKAALGTVTVSASAKGTADLTVTGAGTATAGDITVTGNDASHRATLTVSGTTPTKVGENQPNNLTAESLTVNGFGTANLNAAYVLINGDVTVAKDGSLATDTDNNTTVAKTLTLAKGAELTNSGALTVGTLVNNAEIANSGSLTIKGVDGATSVNAGTILSDADKNVTVTGNFDNQLYVNSTSKTSATNLTAKTLTVSKGTFNNAGIVDVTTLTLDEGAVYNTTYLTEAPTTNTATTTYTEAETIDVNEGAILNIADLNQASVKNGANDQLAIVSKINLNGGVLQVKGASTETVDVVLSEKLTVGEKSEQTFKSVLAQNNGDLTINGGKVTVTGALETSGGSVNRIWTMGIKIPRKRDVLYSAPAAAGVSGGLRV